MNTVLHTINMAGRKNPPGGALVELKIGMVPGTADVRVKLPGQAEWREFPGLMIKDGVLELPIALVFLCHASEDKAVVQKIGSDLTRDGYMTWYDSKDLLAGADWKQEIEKALERSDYALVFLSRQSCSKTGYVQREIRYALEQHQLRPQGKRFIIPILIDDCEPPSTFKDIHWLRMSEIDWYEKLKRALELER